MPGFTYHEVDEIEPDLDSSIQEPGKYSTSPMKPILSLTPLYLGILQVLDGLITAGLGGVEVFLVPVLISRESNISLNYFNCYGAAIFSGFLLVLAGSCAIRAHIKRDRIEALRFYGVTLFAFLGVLSLVVFTQVCYTKWWTHLYKDIAPYYICSLLSTISSIVGLLLLMMTVSKYFHSLVLKEGKMLELFIVCCCPCCSKKADDDDYLTSI